MKRSAHPRRRARTPHPRPSAAVVDLAVLDRQIRLAAEARAVVDLVLATEPPPIGDADAARRQHALRVVARLLVQAEHGVSKPRP